MDTVDKNNFSNVFLSQNNRTCIRFMFVYLRKKMYH